MGARGNSGVIFSQVVRGFVEVLGLHEGVSSSLLSKAFRGASDTAYRAVKRPVEGTMLTVIREMAEESERKEHRELRPNELLQVVLARGELALARTPEMLDVLRNAGVVDAGGAGLVEIARGMVYGALGEEIPDAPVETEALGLDAIHQELSEFRYCTVFVVEGENLDKDDARERARAIGDSLLVVGDETALKVHVHTDDPGKALNLGTAVGVVEGVEIANMHHQTAQREERLLEGAPTAAATLVTGLVAVCPGRGNRRLFESLGATRVIEGGQSMNPSAADILAATDAVPSNRRPRAAEQLERDPHRRAGRSAQRQGGAGRPLEIGPGRAGRDDRLRRRATSRRRTSEPMLAALDGVATGEITVASRDASLDGVEIREGAYLGLVDDVAVVSGTELDEVVHEVVDRVLAGGQGFLTILTGEGAPPLDGLVAAVEARHPHVEVEIHEGGQPHYPLLLVAQ